MTNGQIMTQGHPIYHLLSTCQAFFDPKCMTWFSLSKHQCINELVGYFYLLFTKKVLTGNLLLNRIDSSGGLSLQIILNKQMLSSNKGLAT
jgi:hypothetical protein